MKTDAGTTAPTQYDKLVGTTTFGVGFTVMVYETGVPAQPLAVGVTVIVATTGVVLVLTAANEAIGPDPDAGIPIEGLSLVHVNVVPVVVLVKFAAGTVNVLQ